MSNRTRLDEGSAAGSKTREALATALRTNVDLSLVAEGAPSSRAHSKSTVDDQPLPNPSRAAQARTLRLARRLASSR